MTTKTDNAITGGDDRLRRDDNAGSRENRSTSDKERTDKDGTVFSAPERVHNFRTEWEQNALPQPPEVLGYHLCWLSTTNNYDPIHKRMRMGYEPVKAEEVEGFETYKMKSGEFEGFVACNEMLLFKIKKEIYQDMMSYFHHEQPLKEEEMLRSNEILQDKNSRSVAQPDDDGFKSLGKSKHAPVFN